MEFSSPHKAKELNQIPTILLRFLVVFAPSLHRLAHFSQIVRCRTTQSQTIILLFVWNALCLWTLPLFCILPCVFIYTFLQSWFKSQITKPKSTPELALDDTLHDIAIILEAVDYFKQQWTPVWCYVDGTNSSKSLAFFSGLVYGWPVWIVLCYIVGTNGMFAILGSLCILTSSPQWLFTWRMVSRNRVLIFALTSLWAYTVALISTMFTPKPISVKNIWWQFRSSAKSEKQKVNKLLSTKTVSEKEERNEIIFLFEIYENQRWWLGANWTTDMMPDERGPWTDAQLNPILSKDDFKLPKTTTDNPEIRKYWEWVNKEDWWIADKGWEYSDNSWQFFSSEPSMQTFTRRRRWCRRAKLVEIKIGALLS